MLYNNAALSITVLKNSQFYAVRYSIWLAKLFIFHVIIEELSSSLYRLSQINSLRVNKTEQNVGLIH